MTKIKSSIKEKDYGKKDDIFILINYLYIIVYVHVYNLYLSYNI